MNPRSFVPPTLLLAGLALCAPHAQASAWARVQQESAVEMVPEQPTKGLRRILHLRGGTTLRVVARLVDGVWEYKQGGEYRPLPPDTVVRSALERSVLAELSGREKALAEDDYHGRALCAAWMMEQGLLEEGMGLLEEILQREPDQLSARTALLAHRARFRVPEVPSAAGPERWDEIVAWSAERGRVSRELVLGDLAQASEADRVGLRERLAAELVERAGERRSFAAHALRRLFPGEEVRPLLVRAVLDSSPGVRAEASYALREVRDESVAVPLVRALGSDHAIVRTHAAEALGNLGYAAAVAPLMARLSALQSGGGSRSVPHGNIFVGRQFAYIQDFDVEVAQFQAIADPNVNVLIEGAVLDAGVVAVEHAVIVRESRAIRSALAQLTGANPGSRNQDWLGWWEKRQGSDD